MALLNTGISLPPLDIEALIKGQSILAMPQRFIVPGKRFLLCPSQQPDPTASDRYRPEVLALHPISTETNRVRAWAKCDLCQHFTEADPLRAFSQHTIWSTAALVEYLHQVGHVFMAFFQVYHLPEPLDLPLANNGPVGGFVPLADYLDVDESHPALGEADFLRHKRQLLDLKPALRAIEIPDDSPEDATPATETAAPSLPRTPDVVNSDDWYDHISRVGNSSDGTTFERLVRKSLQFLGFSNSQPHAKANLDYNSTGGAGGLDFFADLPYPVVGECKATKTEKVPDGVSAQLIKLGHNHLESQYNDCIKIIVVAGKLTDGARNTSKNNEINVIRPEELQRLVVLKRQYPNAVNLYQLKPVFEQAPFGEAANDRLKDFIENIWKQLKERSEWIERVRLVQESRSGKPVNLDDISMYCHLTKLDIDLNSDLKRGFVRDLLIELSSPLAGCLNKIGDRFEFVKSLEIQD
ncbi:MAG: DUF1802 family protein [Nodosilinea sp.]